MHQEVTRLNLHAASLKMVVYTEDGTATLYCLCSFGLKFGTVTYIAGGWRVDSYQERHKMYSFTQAFGSASSSALSVYLFSREASWGLNKCKVLRCPLLSWLFLLTSLMQKKKKKVKTCVISHVNTAYIRTHRCAQHHKKKGIKFNKRAPEME